jgi:acyl carrier protein
MQSRLLDVIHYSDHHNSLGGVPPLTKVFHTNVNGLFVDHNLYRAIFDSFASNGVNRLMVDQLCSTTVLNGNVLLRDLAVDSIQVASAVAKLEKTTRVHIGLDTICDCPTVGQLAKYISTKSKYGVEGNIGSMPDVVISPVETEVDMQAVGSLRYKVTVEEMGLTMAFADHRRRIVSEPLDRCGLVLAARHRGEVVGTVRVNLLREADVGYYFEAYGLGLFDKEVVSSLSISTRLAIDYRYRKGGLLVKLARAAYQHLLQKNISHNVMDCRKPLLPNFLQLGYKTHIADLAHPEFGDVVVLALDIRDTDRLRQYGSPLVSEGEQGDFLRTFNDEYSEGLDLATA